MKDDLDFSHFQSPGQHRLLDAATNGAWVGCNRKTVAAEVTHLAARGVGNCTSFHKELLDDGIREMNQLNWGIGEAGRRDEPAQLGHSPGRLAGEMDQERLRLEVCSRGGR